MPEAFMQDYLFRKIRECLPPQASLADTVADLLYVSPDSAYRRIRGETPLVLDEARILCRAFSLSLDEVLAAEENSVSFRRTRIDNGDHSFIKYLEEILGSLIDVDAADDKSITYLSKDIPLFYNFMYRPLFAFRYFFWMKSILQHPDYVQRPFTQNVLPPAVEAVGRRISHLYGSIPSIEIWNTECINSTIAQVEYYREAGYFADPAEIEAIYASLHELLEHIRLQAEWGSKFLPGEAASLRRANYTLFHNRLVLGDNTLLVRAHGRRQIFLGYDVLNYLSTADAAFCSGVEEQLHTLMRRATILSSGSEKQRNIFFHILQKKLPLPAPQSTSSL